jgi:hypothetical protein
MISPSARRDFSESFFHAAVNKVRDAGAEERALTRVEALDKKA